MYRLAQDFSMFTRRTTLCFRFPQVTFHISLFVDNLTFPAILLIYFGAIPYLAMYFAQCATELPAVFVEELISHARLLFLIYTVFNTISY